MNSSYYTPIMKKFTFTKLMLLVLVIASCKTTISPEPNVSDQALLLYNANVIDVENGKVLKNKAILIDSGTIRSIGNHDSLKSLVKPSNAIDVAHKFIIPGLWDMHVHIEGEDLIEDNLALFPVYIAYGITTVRDMASDLGEQVLNWREEIKEEKILGPQIFTAGRKLEGINSIWKGDLEIANEEDLEQMLSKLEADKVDLVKITENTLSGPLFLKSVKEANKRGFLVSGHVPIDLSINELVEAGLSSIEHASYLLRLGADEKNNVSQLASGTMTKSEANTYYTSHFNQEIANEAYKKLGETDIAVTPTLIGGKQLAFLDENDHSKDGYLKYLTNRFTSKYKWRMDRMVEDTPEQKQGRKDRYTLLAKQLPQIQSAGITILAGSDAAALNTFVYPALALHEELVLFQEAGLTPIQILQSATINGAKFMGKLNTMGTIAIDKQADLVILNSNPLNDIKSTQDIYAVINNGVYYIRKDLDSLLNQAALKKIQLDKQRD